MPQLLALLIVCTLALPAFAQKRKGSAVPQNARLVEGIEYAKPGGVSLKLDLYLPTDVQGQRPAVVFVHGGGWKNGSRKRCFASDLSGHGFVVASIDYRLTDQAQWPAQIEDCRAAVRWLRKHAGEYGVDSDQIGCMGSSAGGHLVALMGTLPTPEDERISSKVQAVCDWFGPTDLLTMPPNVVGPKRTKEQVAQSNGAKLLGSPVPDVPELAQHASAFYQVSADDPPTLIMHGENDPGVPLVQSQKFYAALKEAGVSARLEIIPGAGHGGAAFQTPAVKRMVREFFEEHLTGQPAEQ